MPTHKSSDYKLSAVKYAISSKGVIGYEVYKKGGIDSVMYVFLDHMINHATI